MRRRRTALAAALALAVAAAAADADEPEPPAISERECGKAALAMLLLMETTSDPARAFDLRLADPPEAGYSMLELQEAAKARGLDVETVDLGRDGAAVDRSMVVLLCGPSSNHYVLARPVPGRRPMVQIIDPRGFSSISRPDELASSPAWTGLALRPRRTSFLGARGAEAAIAAAVAGAVHAAALLVRSKRSADAARRPRT